MAALVSIPLTRESPYTKDPYINEQIARPNFFALFGKEAIAGTISTSRK